jgi:hypothetical protein
MSISWKTFSLWLIAPVDAAMNIPQICRKLPFAAPSFENYKRRFY